MLQNIYFTTHKCFKTYTSPQTHTSTNTISPSISKALQSIKKIIGDYHTKNGNKNDTKHGLNNRILIPIHDDDLPNGFE